MLGKTSPMKIIYARRLTMKKTLLLSLCLIILITLAACLILIFGRLLYLDTYKDVIISSVEKALHRRVTYKNGAFSLGHGATFSFTKATIMERDGSTVFISAQRINFRIALLPLIEKKLVLKEVRLEEPNINLTRLKNGKFNFSDILEGGTGEGIPLLIRSVSISNGSTTLSDQAISQQGVVSSLNNIDLFISRLIRGKSSIFRLSATIPGKTINGKLSVSGTAKLPSKNGSLVDTSLDIRLTATNLNAAHYWDYYSRYVPFGKIFGNLDLDSEFKGKLPDFSSSGTVKVSGLYFNYPQVFHSILNPKEVRIKYNMQLTPNDLVVRNLVLDVDKLSVKGSCALNDIYSGNLFISAKAVTNRFRLEEFSKYIPYGIIPKNTSEFIEKRILGGTYRLQEGSLKGRVSQIAHMEKGTNYNILFIKGTVDRGLVSFGDDIPTFNDIRGNLAMRGKEFILAGMEGRFGNSPFKLEGKIADYPLNTPSRYPFTMTMIPDRAEVLWLLDHHKSGSIGFKGSSTLYLSGSGNASNYLLNGKWDVTTAAYKYSNIINKPAGVANRISFKGSIGKDVVNIASLQYALKSMLLSASGKYRPIENKLEYSINSDMFPIQDVAYMIPRLEKYMAKGGVKAAIQGNVNTEKTIGNKFDGNVFLSDVSVKPSDDMKYIENINGNIRFSKNTLSTSQLSAKLGNTTISAGGTLTGFNNPTMDITFSSPELNFPDIGFQCEHAVPPARNVRGNFTFKDGNLNIRELSFLIGKSFINADGTIEDIKKPVLNISVSSPFLALDDLLALKGLGLKKKGGEVPTRISGKVDLKAEAGKFRQLPFGKLKTAILFRDKTIQLQPTEADVAGGTIYARGLMDSNTAGKPLYQVSFNMKNLSAASIQQSFDIKREITGKISMEGELSAEGDNLQEVKKTVHGNLKLRCEQGSLRKFAVLSKIFSILNVSQLFKLHLPDMVLGGMPYNDITGTFSIQNGIAVTDDFFIDSDAINISAIGKFDLPEEKLDLTIGVKPLQTVDKIVSHIPIVGWVLTGKNKSLVTAYFEARGSWDNPHVKAISLKSLAKGVFNIFKRVFQLPAKLITDTGEVIIGNPD
jgi:uncharacterized protein involved in outer membrane biogenesis